MMDEDGYDDDANGRNTLTRSLTCASVALGEATTTTILTFVAGDVFTSSFTFVPFFELFCGSPPPPFISPPFLLSHT